MKIAIIAHDGKKAQMVQFLYGFKKFLDKIEVVATGTTGTYVEAAGISVQKVMSGPLGGDAQIATMVVEKEIDFVVFFIDPLDRHPHEPDINMLLRLSNVHNIPLATNPASAELIIKSLIEKRLGKEID